MELFKNDGHLSDEGIQSLIDGQLDELQSLEAAEHLGFCDDCLIRYTDLLTDDVLLSPQESLEQPVTKRIKNKKMHLFFRKTSTIAAAALIATGIWSVGLFSSFFTSKTSPAEITPPTQNTQKAFGSIGHEISNFFSLFTPTPSEPSPQEVPKSIFSAPTQSTPN